MADENTVAPEVTVSQSFTKTSPSIANLAKALSQFQKEINNPANTAVNPFYKSKYAPLSDVLNVVRPILGKYGLSIIQPPSNDNDGVYIRTLLMHESGEWIETEPLILKPEKNTPQGVGSAITYGRRYAISSVLGISSEEDDDGNANEKKADDKGNAKSTTPSKPTETKPDPKYNPESDDDVKSVTSKIAVLAKEKAAISADVKADVKTVLAKYHVSGNPNKIEDIVEARKCYDEINNIKGNK